MSPHQLGELFHLDLTPDEARRLHRQVARYRVHRPQRWKVRHQTLGAHLEQTSSPRKVAKAVLAKIEPVAARHQCRRRRGDQDLAAVPRVHHPGGPVQHGPEVVVTATVGLTGGDAHAHRQPQCPLGLDSGVDRGASRDERRAHAVAGVLEQPTVMGVDGRMQHLVVRSQRQAHLLRVGLPATRRTLDIGEQKRHRPRRPLYPHKARSYASLDPPCARTPGPSSLRTPTSTTRNWDTPLARADGRHRRRRPGSRRPVFGVHR